MNLTENNTLISEAVSSIIWEAITHFNKPTTRKSPENPRYFYKKTEVDAVISQLMNPESVKIKIEYESDGITPFCYIMDYAIINHTKRFKGKEAE